MKSKCCKTCIINSTCTKNYDDNTLCQDARNELGYHLYRNHKSFIVLKRYEYLEISHIFNDETIKYIKEKLKRCRPKKQYRTSTIKRIENKIKEESKLCYEDLMDQIYGGCDRSDDAPGYRN